MFYISPDIISAFFDRATEVDYCPSRVFNTIISPVVYTTDDKTLYKNYFNTLCLSVSSSGEIVDDLPRKEKNGSKKVEQLRIEQQALVFRQKSKKYLMVVEPFNVFTQVNKVLNSEFAVTSKIPVFPTPIMGKNLSMAGIFLELTSDINSKFGSCWGMPHLIDKLHPKLSRFILNKISVDENPSINELLTESVVNMCHAGNVRFFYWVFGYSNRSLDDKFIPIEYDISDEIEIKELLRKTMSLIEYNDKTGWKTNPCYKLCNDCPLKATCSDYDVFN